MTACTLWRCRNCGLSGEVHHQPTLPAQALIQKVRDQHYSKILENGKICRWNPTAVVMRRRPDNTEEKSA